MKVLVNGETTELAEGATVEAAVEALELPAAGRGVATVPAAWLALSDGVLYEGYTRVRPAVPAPHPKFDTRLV